MPLPNLLIIGAMKAGTTSLHNYLNMHPNINMSEPKELNFFSDDDKFKKGISYYETFFKDGCNFNGESSVNYTKRHRFPDVALRISETLGPNAKLIYIVRNPIDRLQSNFTDSKTYGDIPSSYNINDFINEGLESNPFVKGSMYYYQIEQYLKYFSVDNMYFLKSEDLKLNPQKTMDLLFQFLGLQEIDINDIELNKSTSKRYYSSTFLKINNNPLLQSIKKCIPKQIKKGLRESSVVEKIYKRKIDNSLDVINQYNRIKVKDFLKEDLKKFEEISNITYF